MSTATMRWRKFWPERNDFWARADQQRVATGKYPDWAFDFISIHDHRPDGSFCLCAPLCIIEKHPKQKRPAWERHRFTTLGAAIRDAKRLAEIYGSAMNRRIHVVACLERI